MKRLYMLAALLALCAWNSGCKGKTEATSDRPGATSTTSHGHDHDGHDHDAHDHEGHDHEGQDHDAPADDDAAAARTVERGQAEEALAADAPPAAVVTAFLEATRRGDDALASQLLSAKALAETTRVGLAVKPPGTPTMQYTIGEVEYPEGAKDGAYVHSIWKEVYEGGEETFDVTWVLRKQPQGWRIVGMAAQLDEDLPYFLNFEQPEDLYRKMQEAQQPTGEEAVSGEPVDAASASQADRR
jgi:hypothetical protein